jgi:hypothetical protein
MTDDCCTLRNEGTSVHIRDLPPARAWPSVELGDWANLERKEAEILERIRSTPNGGLLFLTNPLRALHDLGFDLCADLKAELFRREPTLASRSDAAYEAIKLNRVQYSLHISLNGLFRRETP